MAGQITFRISGQDPRTASAAIYSNFVGISRLGHDVEFEFIFVDLNQMAELVLRAKEGQQPTTSVEGKTVAKIVMPGASLVQVREHLNTILDIIAKDLEEAKRHESDRNRAKSG